MATITVTHPTNTAFDGKVVGVQFNDGTGTFDDTTAAGLAAKGFFTRRGWAFTGKAAVTLTVDAGKPVATWTATELKAYLDAQGVQYPSNTAKPGLLAAAQDAFETKAQGGSAVNLSAGHIMGTMPVEGADNVPGDNESTANKWVTPLIGNTETDVAPAITTQPASQTVTNPAPATFSVVVTGTPTPAKQWQKAEASAPTVWTDVAGATGSSYTTGATSAADNGDKYRVVLDNTDGSVTSAEATLTVN